MNKEDEYIYLKCGANILRIKSNYLKEDLSDYANYLEIFVADGHGKYHYERNGISVCITEDFDIKKLATTIDPSLLEKKLVFITHNFSDEKIMNNSSSGEAYATRIVRFAEPNNKKRNKKMPSKDLKYAY